MPLTHTTASYLFSNPQGMIILGYGVSTTTAPSSYYYLAYSAMRNLSSGFYVNDIYCHSLQDTAFLCSSTVNFRAEIEGLHPDAGSLKWFVNGDEEIAARDQQQWNRSFNAIGNYEIKMWVRYEDNTEATIISTLKINARWVKIRNVRY
jgi:hypothetical protein